MTTSIKLLNGSHSKPNGNGTHMNVLMSQNGSSSGTSPSAASIQSRTTTTTTQLASTITTATTFTYHHHHSVTTSKTIAPQYVTYSLPITEHKPAPTATATSATLIKTLNSDAAAQFPKSGVVVVKPSTYPKPANLNRLVLHNNHMHQTDTASTGELHAPAPAAPAYQSAFSKLERNYSYIEAMKGDDSPPMGNGCQPDEESVTSKTLLSTSPSPPTTTTLSASSSPSTSSSSSSSSSPSSSSKSSKSSSPKLSLVEPNPPAVKISPKSNLSKSQSQSSILNLFKSTFSPFTIRKWRSKSRDKLSTDSDSAGADFSAIEPPPPPPAKKSSTLKASILPIFTEKKYVKNQPHNTVKKLKRKEAAPPPPEELAAEKPPLPVSPKPTTTNFVEQARSPLKQRASVDTVDSFLSLRVEPAKDAPLANPAVSLRINGPAPVKPEMMSWSKLKNASSPQSERQLSYLKLACLVNGYDSTSDAAPSTPPPPPTPPQPHQSESSRRRNVVVTICQHNKTPPLSLTLDCDDLRSSDMLNGSERFYNLRKKSPVVAMAAAAKKSPTVLVVEVETERHEELTPAEPKPADRRDEPAMAEPKEPNYVEVIVENGNKNPAGSGKINKISETQTNSELPQVQTTPEPAPSDASQLEAEVKDGNYYIKLLDNSTSELNELCKSFQSYVDPESNDYVSNDDALGQIQTTIGKAQLLVTQKFKQFRGLCVKNIKDKTDSSTLNEGEFVTRDDDLAGFWDMVCLQIDDIQRMFRQLDELKKNEWKMITKPIIKRVEKKKAAGAGAPSEQRSTTPVKSSAASSNGTPGVTVDATKTSSTKARADAARQRLLEAKRNAALAKQKEASTPQQNVDIAIFDPKRIENAT